MGDYYDDRRRGRDRDEPERYKTTRNRPARRNEPEYVEETTFIETGRGKPPRELVYRGRERDSSVEDIPRDFSPPSGRRPRGYDDYGAPPRRARSVASRRDDYDDAYLPAGVGAAAGYAAARAQDGRRRRDRDRDQYYSEDDRSPPRRPERRKSELEKGLEAVGLGGVVGALTGKSKDKDKARGRDRSSSGERGGRGRSKSRGGDTKRREWVQAAQAAVIAGAVEAFRSRGEPGPWKGEKGKRIATAAISAGGIDKLIDRNPKEHKTRHIIESVVGGLAANRLANGPAHSRSRDARGRSRSRSQSVFSRYRSKSRGRGSSAGSDEPEAKKGDKVKDVGAGVILAGLGKQAYDSWRSRSRRRRSPSPGSDDNHADRRRRDRDRDVVKDARGSLRGGAAGGVSANGDNQVGRPRRKSLSSSDSDSASDTDIENQRKKMRGKEYLTAALATIATIHAAHNVYQSMEASENRHKLVAEGEMSIEEARKKRSKAWLQDAAAIGIAALGIKGAYSEWKEMNEQRHHVKEIEKRRLARQKRRERRVQEARLARQRARANGGPYMSGGVPAGQVPGPPR